MLPSLIMMTERLCSLPTVSDKSLWYDCGLVGGCDSSRTDMLATASALTRIDPSNGTASMAHPLFSFIDHQMTNEVGYPCRPEVTISASAPVRTRSALKLPDPVRLTVPDLEPLPGACKCDQLVELLETVIQARSVNHVVMPPVFDGRGDVYLFLERFKEVRHINGWEDGMAMVRLKSCLIGDATNCATGRSLVRVERNLQIKYGYTVREARRRIAELQSKSGQDLFSSAVEIDRLVRVGYPGETEDYLSELGIRAFLKTITSAELTKYLLKRKPQDVMEAVALSQSFIVHETSVCAGWPTQTSSARGPDKCDACTTTSSNHEKHSLPGVVDRMAELCEEIARTMQPPPESRRSSARRGPRDGCWTCGGPHYQSDCKREVPLLPESPRSKRTHVNLVHALEKPRSSRLPSPGAGHAAVSVQSAPPSVHMGHVSSSNERYTDSVSLQESPPPTLPDYNHAVAVQDAPLVMGSSILEHTSNPVWCRGVDLIERSHESRELACVSSDSSKLISAKLDSAAQQHDDRRRTPCEPKARAVARTIERANSNSNGDHTETIEAAEPYAKKHSTSSGQRQHPLRRLRDFVCCIGRDRDLYSFVSGTQSLGLP